MRSQRLHDLSASAHHGAGHHRLDPWQRRLLYGCGLVLLLTGLGWLALHYLVGAGAGELPHPLEAWAMRLHGLAMYGALFVLGAVAAGHVPRGWRMSARPRWAHQRGIGVLLCGLAAALALSAFGLSYLVPEAWHDAVGWLHAGLGVLLGLVLVVHVRRSRGGGRADHGR